MSAKGYTTKTKLENYTLQTIASSFDSQIDAWIESVEKFIENFTGRVFIADSVASERLYDGEGSAEQKFDDFVVVSKVEVGEDTKTEVEDGDYRVYPANSERKHTIQCKYTSFLKGNQNVTITAKWGYSVACPADVVLATTILVAGIVNYSNNAKGKIRQEAVGPYSVTYADEKGWQDFNQAMKILQAYKKYTF